MIKPDVYRARFVEADRDGANRLIDSTSPYLLQHAHNPVDWYPWGTEAFEAARSQGKPIFLSVGYSTCYWCHVMERESFEDESVASLMNEHFVCIKVDREERPDVDDLYMTAVQLFSNGHGGWPMSVFLEPVSLEPFFAGTYFPPEDRHGRPGLKTLLARIAQMWAADRETLLSQADRAASAITAELQSAATPVALDRGLVENARVQLLASHDPALGGFDSAPKFPQPARLQFLLDTAWDDDRARAAVLTTLDAMARGGICDQVGGGFHRYSTDARWLVPHFEKMLYDNGQLAEAYARAFELTADPWLERTLRGTLDWVLREMTGEGGRFYSAQDAEVDAREGASHTWTREEIGAALRSAGLEDEIEFTEVLYGLDHGTNFRDPHDPSATARNVLFLDAWPAPEDLERIDRIDAALLSVRNARKQPITDDKTLAGWNGLMIAGLAEGGRVLKEESYIRAAQDAAGFVLGEMRDREGGLLRSWRGGRASIPAFLEDYAFLVHGLFRLHRATGEDRWADAARRLVREADALFDDPQSGGYFDSRADQQELFVRVRARYDGATPSPNSQMVLNLLDAHEATREGDFLAKAASTLGSLSRRMREHPTSLLVAMRGLDRVARDHPEALPTGEAADAPGVVSVTAEPSRLDLRSGPAELEVRLHIADGYHVNAHDPGAGGLTGLALVLVGGGVLLEVDYPAGTPLRTSFADDPVLVHEGEVVLRARLQVLAPGSSGDRLVLRWQACDETACLAPAEQVLPVAIRTH